MNKGTGGRQALVRASEMRCRTTSNRYASGKWGVRPIPLKWSYGVDVRIISGKPVAPLMCQTFEIGENIDWEFGYQDSNNGDLVLGLDPRGGA